MGLAIKSNEYYVQSEVVLDFQLSHNFQQIKTDLRLMTNSANSIYRQFITTQHKGYFIICTTLEGYQYCHSYI